MRRALASLVCAALIVTASPLAGYQAAAQVIVPGVEGVPRLGSPMPIQAAAAPAPISAQFSAPPLLSAAPSAAFAAVSVPAALAPALAPAAAAASLPVPASVPAGNAAARGLGGAAASLPAAAEGPESLLAWAAQTFDASKASGSPEIVKHDGHRFELNLDVRLVPHKKNVYRVGAYFFVPHALGITPETFTKESFYQHIQRRIRFTTPKMSLAEILDKGNQASPLNRLSDMLAGAPIGAKDAASSAAAYTEIRMLGLLASAAMRDQARAVAADLPARRGEIGRLVADARRLTDEVRLLRAASAGSGEPAKIRETVNFLDEYLSLSIAEQFAPLLTAVRQAQAPGAAASPENSEISELIVGENAYRVAAGYPSVADKATDSEALFYRRAVLKNLFASVLDLETKTNTWSGAFQFLFSLSAAAAMLIYLVAMRVVSGHVPVGGMEFLVIAMGAYVVKDRVKEYLRAWTTRRWRRFFSDEVTTIRDPATGKAVGRVRESFGFVPRSDIPAEVLRIRQADPLAVVGEDGKPEDVLRYEKDVTIRPKAIEKFHTRRRDLDDSLLVNLFPFLENTEDPKVGFTYLDPASGELEALKGSRVYHINMVTRHEVREPSDRASSSYERLRVVLDRDGIKRIEKVPVR